MRLETLKKTATADRLAGTDRGGGGRSGGDPGNGGCGGTVRSRLQAQVEIKVAGRGEFIRGSRPAVQAGDVLVRLGCPEWTARRDQALAVREQADPATWIGFPGAGARWRGDGVRTDAAVWPAGAAANEAGGGDLPASAEGRGPLTGVR